MPCQIRVEAGDRFWNAHSADEVLALEELEGAIDSCRRESAEVALETLVDRIRGWVTDVLNESAVDGEPLGSDPNASSSA
jgi:hypothetical protein